MGRVWQKESQRPISQQHNSIIRAPLAFARRFLKVWRLTLCLVTFTFAMLFPVLVHATQVGPSGVE
jgi:hypothetical protein